MWQSKLEDSDGITLLNGHSKREIARIRFGKDADHRYALIIDEADGQIEVELQLRNTDDTRQQIENLLKKAAVDTYEDMRGLRKEAGKADHRSSRRCIAHRTKGRVPPARRCRLAADSAADILPTAPDFLARLMREVECDLYLGPAGHMALGRGKVGPAELYHQALHRLRAAREFVVGAQFDEGELSPIRAPRSALPPPCVRGCPDRSRQGEP